MKARILWCVLVIPVLPIALIFILLSVVEYLGGRAGEASDLMLDSATRERYLKWVEKISGFKH